MWHLAVPTMIRSLCNMLMAFGQKSVEVYEWDRHTIVGGRLDDHAAWVNVTNPRAQLQFTGWELAHAVVKADFVTSGNYGLASLGFLFQMDRILDFTSSPNLRLATGAARAMNDVTKTSVIGRVGRGLSILFAQSLDYRFACHLATLPEVGTWLAANRSTKEGKKVADFLFENGAGHRMILESKATFTLDTNNPIAVKGKLRPALMKQVEPWMPRINPAALKGFAVHSALRERGAAPSAIAFVDPEEDGPAGEASNSVRRKNYAAWLAVMGIRGGADRLRGTQGEDELDPTPAELIVAEVGGREYALISVDEVVFPPVVIKERWPYHRPTNAFGDSRLVPHLFAIGLEIEGARAVQKALQGNDQALLAYRPNMDGEEPADEPRSIFPDGTFFGLIRLDEIRGSEQFVF